MKRIPLGPGGLNDLPELTNEALEVARWDPGIGCLIDRVYPGRPLVISFGFLDWRFLPVFDFFGRTKKLEDRIGAKFNRLLVRDVVNGWYHRGVNGLGAHVDEVAASLRALVEAIAPDRVIAIGQSMGGYAAIMFGMLLGVDRVVAFCPLSYFDPVEAVRDGDLRFLNVMQGVHADPPPSGYYDLVRLGRERAFRGDLHVVFGTHPRDNDGVSGNLDAVQAFRLARLPNTVLHPYPESDHTIVQWLGDHGRIDDLLARLLAGEGAGASGG